jgi:cytoskeletal protein CcmA (bactofilin family)
MNFGGRSQASKEPPPAVTDKVETVIGANVIIKGTFISQGSIRIDGLVEGAIEAKGNVIVGEGARVVANITAYHVSVAGQVKGSISASGRLEITSKGRVWGDIVAASLAVDEGGVLSGRSQLRDADAPPDLAEGIASAKKPSAPEK